MGPAAQRIAARADDEDHQHLGRQRLDEPAGLEQRFAGTEDTSSSTKKVRKSNTELTGPNTSMKLRMKSMSQRAGCASTPSSTSSIGIGDLGHVVEQVVQQDLDRQHRQERQEQRGAGHAEHVAEVRAGAHQDVLHDVAERAPALEHAVVQHRKVVLEQDDVGRLLGDVGGAVDRDADVGGVQRRRIVDAVAEEADDVAAPLQRQDDPVLSARA